MTSFEPELYGSETKFPLFPRNLESFTAPSLKKTVPDMFKASPKISRIMLNAAEEIAPYTFRGCRGIYMLGIAGVEQLGENALSDCVIRFADAPNLVSAKSLPNNSGILLSNNFVEAYETAEALTVYGTAGTFVERYANYKGYEFVPIPFVANEMPKYITEDSERVNVSAVGFDLQYQWYWNTENSAEGGTPIEGATGSAYTFTPSDTAPYYYCVITQNDLGTITKVTTEVIIKDSTPADYTEYNKAVEKAKAVNRDLTEPMVLDLDLRSFGDLRPAMHSVLHHDDMKAENTESAPDVVKPVILPCPKPGEPLVLPAASWNVIRFVKG